RDLREGSAGRPSGRIRIPPRDLRKDPVGTTFGNDPRERPQEGSRAPVPGSPEGLTASGAAVPIAGGAGRAVLGRGGRGDMSSENVKVVSDIYEGFIRHGSLDNLMNSLHPDVVV